MEIDAIINLGSHYSIFIPFLIGLIFIKNLGNPYILLFVLIIIGAINEMIRLYYFGDESEKFILNIYTLVETVLLALIYHKIIVSEGWKRGIRISLFLLLTFFLLNMLFGEGLYLLNEISMNLECTFMIILSAALFQQLIQSEENLSLFKRPAFWYNIGVFIYFSLNFFTFLMSNELYNQKTAKIFGFHLWHINNLSNLLFNLSFAYSFWLLGKPKHG